MSATVMVGLLATMPAMAAAMFRCDAQHTGVCATQGLRDALTDAKQPGQAPVAWRITLGELDRSSPVVAGNVLYVGSNDGEFFAIRTSDGKRSGPSTRLVH